MNNGSNHVSHGIVTEQGAAELMKILLERGYFHAHSADGDECKEKDDSYDTDDDDDDDDADDDDAVVDKARAMKKSSSSHSIDIGAGAGAGAGSGVISIGMSMAKSLALMSLEDAFMVSSSSLMNAHGEEKDATKAYSWDDSMFVVTVEGSYVTVEALRDQYCEHLAKTGRWKSLKEAAGALGIHEKDARRIVAAVLKYDSTLLQAGDQVLTKKCLDDMTQQVFDALENSEGRLALEDIAKNIYHLPTTVSFDILQNRLKETTNILRLGSGCKVIVTQDYLGAYRQKVLDHFVALTEPVKVKAVATEQGWEAAWVAKIVRGLELPGKLSGDSYVPSVYTNKRNQAVHDFFAANGFLTAEECPSMGILPSEMKGVLSESFPAAVVLQNCVVHPDMIVTPLQAAIQETLEARGWLDLSVHIPGQILSQEGDANILVRDLALGELDDDESGIAVVSSELALFFSQAFIADVEKKLIPQLIGSFSKKRAEELEGGLEASENGRPVRKSKSKKRASLKAALPAGQALIDDDVVPIEDVIQAVVAAYPDLAEIANTRELLAGSALTELFRQAFYTEEFQSACESAVEAETQRLESERASTASHRKDGACKVQTVEAAFEDPGCFATACYLIQALAKFVKYAVDSGLSEIDVDALKQDMLNGPCADFTVRVTQFCLYKHEVDDNMFSFQAYKIEEEDSSGLPNFCLPVDSATRQFHPTFVSCEPDEESKPRDPLPTLREVLPTSIGVSLARQWVLCGGDCYAGGIKLADDGESIFTRPGDFDAFLAHVEENCLVMCSLPFKKLDKKSEKHFLMERRKRLVHLLEEATVPQKILELAIMILFQLSKNLVVTGSLLRGSILELLTQERKVSADAVEALRELTDSIEKGGDIDEVLVERVKDCGLGRG